jgi:subtilisin family serine protease
MPDAVAERVARDSRVRYVVPDQADHIYQTPTGVDRMEADLNVSDTATNPAGVDVDVAIIDTGVDRDHPSLTVFRYVNFAGGKSDDKNGHGSHVAGTVAATDIGDGIRGIAPGARIWAVQVCKPGGTCARSAIIAGIDYVAANADQIEVANMSLGGSGSDDGNCGLTNNDPEHEAICNAVAAGIVFVVAAGNESDDSANHIPAAYDEVITVSALADFDGAGGGVGAPTCRTDQDDSLASFSNDGADVDLMAPGVCILSTWKDGGTNTISGTSMASPHVAGLAALYVAKNGGATDMAGVMAIRAALIGAGIAQDDASCGLAVNDDTDGFAEPIAFANAVNVGGDGTCMETTPNDAPVVTIMTPADTTTFSSGATVDFTGGASDTEDADVTAADLVWTSDIDNEIGTGASFSTALSEGNHTITAAATDSGTKTGTDVIAITVGDVAPPPPAGDTVAGASVSIRLTNDSGGAWTGTNGITGDTGTVSWKLRNAPSGCYNTAVTDLTATGLTWDDFQPSDPGTC